MPQTVFFQRLQKYGPELQSLHRQLYRSEKELSDFISMLEEAFRQRNGSLKALDAQREQDPDWFKGQDMLGMLLYTQCFGGDLKGVASHLDYLQETGVNYLHLMPLLESPPDRSDGGYAVANFRKVQPALGTMEDLAALTAACHEKNMAICLDFVMNHSSEDHAWAVRAKAGEKEYQDRYFFYDNWDIPNEFEKKVPQVFPTTAPGNFSWCEEAQKVVMTTFYPYQWDLNYGNPVVLREMTADMLYLCNQGVDVIRLDATPYIWKELGTDCRNLPQVHTLVRLLHLVCKIVCPGTLLLGEIVMEPSKVVPYFGTVEKPECHMLYNVTTMASLWHTVATADVRLLRHQLGTVFALPKQYTFLNYLRCHDDIGWGLDYPFLRQFGMEEVPHKKYLNDWFQGGYGSNARGELYNDDPSLGDARLCGTTASLCGMEADPDQALKLDEMLHALLLTQSGIPVLYSGDEIGQKNDYTYHGDPLKAADSRYLHRGNMDWEASRNRNDPNTVEGKLFAAIGRLRKARAENPAFHAQADVWILDPHNDQVLAVGRYYKGQALVALFNFSSQAQWVSIREEGRFADLLTGEPVGLQDLVLPGYGFRWIVEKHKTVPDLWGGWKNSPSDYQNNRRKKDMKITFMGAGSTVFARNVIGDCMCSDALKDSTFALYDVDGVRLKESYTILEAMRQTKGGYGAIECYCGPEQRKDALRGADFVVNAIQVGGYDPCTIIDFEIPKKYGLRQTIADTLGIGGIMRALRTIPVMDDFARDMAEVCPNALMLNYTNPMAMLTGYMLRYTPVKTLGLCHSVQVCSEDLLKQLGMEDKLEGRRELIAGINHMAWLLEIKDRNGVDLYPDIKSRIEAKLADPGFENKVRLDYIKHFGYYCTESSEHNAEYNPFYIKRNYPELIQRYSIPLDEYPRRCINQIEGWKKEYAELTASGVKEHTRSHEYASWIMESVVTNTPYQIGGNVLNTGHLITNLPEDACVEVPCLINGMGVNPCRVGALPVQLAAMNMTNINVQLLTIEAAHTRKLDHVYQAAMLDPHTAAELDIDTIKHMVDDLIAAHGDYLPKFS